MTNFEWITQDERMVAIWLSEIGCDTCPAYTYCDKLSETTANSCFATLCSWLKCDAKYEDDVVGMNYCPNCGAKMDEFEEE